jgi:hypothetical protein
MNSFEVTVKKDDYFYYQRGSVKTNKIWTRPSYNKIRDLFGRIKSQSDIFDKYKVYLIGGVLFSFENTWDVDLCLTGRVENFFELEESMNLMYDIALNDIQLLIDVQWMIKPPPIITYDELVSQKYGDYNLKYLKTTYILKKTKNIESLIDLRNCENVNKKTEFLVEGFHNNYPTLEPKTLNRIINNPTKILKTYMDVDEFLNTDETYFYNNTNRF